MEVPTKPRSRVRRGDRGVEPVLYTESARARVY